MLYTPLTKKAMQLSFDAHKDQRDRSGLPYVFHPFYLATQMEGEYETVVALLHDVVEDTPYTLEDLSEMGYPEPVLEALALLTHQPEEEYMSYVARIKSNPIARRVKIADLHHNSDLSRLDSITPKDLERAEKYRQALKLLEE